MLDLDLPIEPRWLPLPQGVRVLAAPLDAPLYEAAVAQAAAESAMLKTGAVTARQLGFAIDLPDLENEFVALGVMQSLLTQAIAVLTIREWEGVGRGTAPAPVDPGNVRRLMLRAQIASSFYEQQMAPLGAVIAEGKGSAPSPDGITGTAPNTAGTAGPAARPAHGTAPAPTARKRRAAAKAQPS